MFGGGIALYFLLPVEPWTLAATLPAVAALAVHLTFGRGGLACADDGRAAGGCARHGGGQAAHGGHARACARAADRARSTSTASSSWSSRAPRKGQRLTIRVTALEKHEAHAWPYRVRVRTMSRDARARARRRRAPQGHAEPAAGTGAARRLRLRAARRGSRRSAPSATRPRRPRSSPNASRAAAVAARDRGGGARAPGHRPARRRGAARPDRRHRQCADHRRARRHLGVDQPGFPRLWAIPHPLDLRPAHGDHGGRGVLLHPPGAGRHPGDRLALPDQEMGGGRARWSAPSAI